MSDQQARTAPARRWRFGRVEFDERSLSLRLDGRPVVVQRKPLAVLQHLLEHAGEAVTKDALIRAAWAGGIVSDAALAQSIARLREALDDPDQNLIKAHYGFGYRLEARVKVEGDAPQRRQADSQAEQDTGPAVAAARTHSAEHRPLTILFCDLVGSTQLAESLDAEAFRDLLIDYQQRVTDICRRYEGHVAQQFGDGLLIYFGYPAAHDDDAERALRCACDLLAALGQSQTASRLSLRIGVHSGRVLIGQSGGHQDVLATGAGVHFAARLQALAEPDTILISDATFRLVPGLFVTRDFGLQELRGMSESVRVHQVLQPSGVRTRLDAAAHLTPFAGREREIGLIESCWREAVHGRGQAVLVSGEPGLGKSRLLLELRERLSRSAFTWLECRAAALSRHSAYQPIIELLQRGMAINAADTDEQRLQRLEQRLDTVNMDKAEVIPLVAPLLNLPLPDRYPASQLGPELRRRRTQEALTGWVQILAYQQPLVIVFEDLHWADDSSLDVLDLLLKQLKDQPILLLVTARTEFVPRGSAPPHLSTQVLEPLPRPDIEQMLDSLTPDTSLSEPLKTLIFDRAGGVPLFVEELTRALLESGQLVERDGQLDLDTPIQQLAIPDSLQGLLMARLDRLGPARELIQTAAVIGRELSYTLIERISGIEPANLRRQLGQLSDAGLLHVRGSPPQATYVFKHALIQDAAYDTLLKARRQALHGAIAAALEAHFPEQSRNEPEVLAAHFEKAQRSESAVHWYTRAAQRAVAACLYRAAIRVSEQALGLVAKLAEGANRDRLELELLVIIGNARIALLGGGNPELDAATLRTEHLTAKVDSVDLRVRALGNLSLMHLAAADYVACERVGEQFLELSRTTGSAMYQGAGHAQIAQACYYSGDLLRARLHYERALQAYDDRSSRDAIGLFGLDGIMFSMELSTNVLWLLGYPDLSLLRTQECQVRAASTGHPQTISFDGFVMPQTLIYRRELGLVIGLTRSAAAYSKRYGFEGWRGFSIAQMGYAQGMLGQFDEGLGLLRLVTGAMRARRAFVTLPMYYSLEAEVCLRAGRTDEAGTALALAAQMIEEHGERCWEAETHRLRGECAFAANPDAVADAEAHFHMALEVARTQSAKSLELRAATSLARLWQRQNRRQDALALLRPVYAWFTEGFETPDLREAAALLAALD